MAARLMSAQAQVCDANTLSRDSSASIYIYTHTRTFSYHKKKSNYSS